ncbi:MAG: NosD domain-containing protein, partial [Candidatus Thermoplasmatota archaeon]|nr:NosD domain-containing protein [Candidatus Thermoplasmatota archaeon]
MDNASNGDIIYVYDDLSPYQENIRINKQILLIGENKETTIINGVTGQDHVVRISSKNVEINGFTIKGSIEGQDGIAVFGLMELCIISNNIIMDNSYGILLQPTSSKITISNNIISNNNYQGILLQSSNRNIITNNTIIKNGDYGISLEVYSIQNKIINNTIENNFAGIKIGGSSSQNNISSNFISDNNMEGILIKGLLSSNNEITRNNITK